MRAKMDIRKADKSDIQEILRLIEDSYTPYRDSIKDIDIPEYSYEEIHELLAESQSDTWIVAEKGKIVGMAAGTEFGPCAYHLKMMFVLGESQHRGVGSALLESFEKRGIERHYSLLTANYLGWANWSRLFYKKHGYREYVAEDEKTCPDIKKQAEFLRKIGRLNNGDKHLIWKRISYGNIITINIKYKGTTHRKSTLYTKRLSRKTYRSGSEVASSK